MPTEPPKKPHESPSSIDTFLKCGLRYKYRKIDSVFFPWNTSMLVGSAVDGAVSEDLAAKMDGGELLPDEAIADLARDKTVNAWDGEEPILKEEEKAKGLSATKGECVDTSVAMAEIHHKELAPGIDPIHIQRGIRLELSNYPFDLLGFLDIQEATTIRDTKTSRKKPSGDPTERNTQLIYYNLAVKTVDGTAPSLNTLDYVVKTKTKCYTAVYDRVIDESDYNRLMMLVENMANALDKGVFMSASRDSWWCAPNWCEYWEHCKFGSKGRTP